MTQQNAQIPDPTSTLPFRRHDDDASSAPVAVDTPVPAVADESPSSASRRRASAPPQFSAMSFVMGLVAGVTITSAMAGVVISVMMLVG